MRKLDALTALQRDRVRGRYEKLVFAILLSYADEHGRCWPSLDTLAEATGLSRRTVVEAVHGLGRHRAGAAVGLRLVRRGGIRNGRGGRASNLYQLEHVDLQCSPRTEPPRLSVAGVGLSAAGVGLSAARALESGQRIRLENPTRARMRGPDGLKGPELVGALVSVAAAAKGAPRERRPESETRPPVRARTTEAEAETGTRTRNAG